MRFLKKIVRQFGLIALVMLSTPTLAEDTQLAGLYNAVLSHEGTNFYQYAKITLRTINVDGQVKIAANARVFFGDWNSNEYLTYEYPEVPLNILTRQVSVKNDANDLSMIGFLRGGVIEGEWFSTVVGRVGTFKALKSGVPEIPADGVLVNTLSGYYRGAINNTNSQSNLPERVAMSFVTTQERTDNGLTMKITGSARFYIGGFGSLEYVETPFANVQFNFYTRYLTVKTQDYGITFKGTMSPDGQFLGNVFSDGLGGVGTVDVGRSP